MGKGMGQDANVCDNVCGTISRPRRMNYILQLGEEKKN